MSNFQNIKKLNAYIIGIQKIVSKIFFVEKSLRSGGFFIYCYGYEVKFCDITIICLKRTITMFPMSQNLDMFIPKDPCDVFGRDIHYLLS